MIRGIIYNYKVVNSPVQQISSNGKEGNENKTKQKMKTKICNASLKTGMIWSCLNLKEKTEWRVKNSYGATVIFHTKYTKSQRVQSRDLDRHPPNLSPAELLGGIILFHGRLSCTLRMFSSIPGLYSLDTISTLPCL